MYWPNPQSGVADADEPCLELAEENVQMFNNSFGNQPYQEQDQVMDLAFPNSVPGGGFGTPGFLQQMNGARNGMVKDEGMNNGPEYYAVNPQTNHHQNIGMNSYDAQLGNVGHFSPQDGGVGGTSSVSSYSSPSTSNSRFNNNLESVHHAAGQNGASLVKSPDTSITSNSVLENEKSSSNPETDGKPIKSKSGGKTKKQILNEQDAILMARDDSELTEEELAMKRKAQNRAAQRAFRERKETKLKDLEVQLLQSEEKRQKLLEQLEEIRQQNISIQTENQLLRSGNDAPAHHVGLYTNDANSGASKFTFPGNPREFVESLYVGTPHVIKDATYNKVYDEPDQPGKKVLAVGAVWDYLQIKAEQPEYEDGLDVYEVMKRLRGNERCHGYGPAYPLELVDKAVAEVANGL